MTAQFTLRHCASSFLLIALALSASCGDRSEHQTRQTEHNPREQSLLIGLLPEQDIFKQVERYQPLTDYLGQQAGVTIKLKILPRYGNIVANFGHDNFDGAFLGSFTFALLHRKLDIEPLARPVGLTGKSTYYGLVFARKDSGIRSAQDMLGKRFAFVEKATTAGYLLPVRYFKEGGIADYNAWFSEVYYAGTHADAINDVLDNKADAGAAKNTIFERLAQTDRRVGEELVILAQSPEVPENTLAVKGDLDPVLKVRLKNTLLTMDSTPEGKLILAQFEAQRFIETREEEYRIVYRYAEEIGLDLATYDYLND